MLTRNNNRSSSVPSIPMHPYSFSVQLRALSTDNDDGRKDNGSDNMAKAADGSRRLSDGGSRKVAPTNSTEGSKMTPNKLTEAQSEIRSLRAGEAMGAMRQYFDRVKEKDRSVATATARESTTEGKTWIALRSEISKSAWPHNPAMRQTGGDVQRAQGGGQARPRILNPRLGRNQGRPASQNTPSSSGAGDEDDEGKHNRPSWRLTYLQTDRLSTAIHRIPYE